VELVGPFVAAVAVLCALTRLHRAACSNQRYRFTSWRSGRKAFVLMLIGAALQLSFTA
jgi:hypothetical protein